MQASPKELPPLGIVFDSDIGGSLDDLLALALLYGAQGREDVKTKVASVSISAPNLDAAAFCDALGQFTSKFVERELPATFRRGFSGFVGLAEGGPGEDSSAELRGTLDQTGEDGEPLYPTQITTLSDTADPAALIRNSLTAYHDQNAVVVLTGPATNLANVLDLNGAMELIKAKVKFLAVAAGTYPSGEAGYNVWADVEAARKLFEQWPTPIVAAGVELGEQLPFPAEAFEHDFGWADRHPIVDAYKAYGDPPYDVASSDLAAALYAARSDAGHFELSAPGTISVRDDGSTEFKENPDGTHSYLKVAAGNEPEVVAAYRNFATAEPAVRVIPPRFRKIIEEEKKRLEAERLKKEQEAQEQQQQQ